MLKTVAVYAAINILLLLFLAVRTARTRQTQRVMLGDGGNDVMLRMVRTHGNAAEYIPAGIAGLTLMALFSPVTPMWLIHAAGGTLTAGRIIHAGGMMSGPLNAGRIVGMLLTWVSFLIMGGALLWLSTTTEF